ncbi:MAG: epoxyqueuosine reductase QueH [Patescibacteria group bacterium]
MVAAKKKVLVHACCAACASYLARQLGDEGFNPVIFFYNPNLSMGEYDKRLSGVKLLARQDNIGLIAPKRQAEDYTVLISPFCDPASIKYINDRERLERRCREILINLLLERTAYETKQNRFHHFTTAMLCSPYRDHSTIWDMGLSAAKDHHLEFYYKDFRKGYWMGRNYARKYNLSIPVYCSDYLG